MKLVIFGLSISSSWGNGHATLWRGLVKGLAKNGHRVVFFERDVPYYAEHRDYTEIPGGELVLYEDWQRVAAAAKRHLKDADVAVVTSYCPDAIAATELVLSSRVRLKTFYDLDTPITLANLDAGRAVNYIGPRGLADFDLVLSFTGGAALTELRTRLGAKRVAALYGSADASVHHPVPPNREYAADLSYLGTYSDDRQASLEMLFVEPARRLPDRRFVLGGSQYPPDFPWTENIFFFPHVAPAEHAAFYCSSKLTLSVTRGPMADMGYCPSGRLFEASACGVPIVSDDWEGLDQFFEPGIEIIIARTTGHAMDALAMSDEQRQRIGRAARERTLAKHTAERRAVELETMLEAGTKPAPEARNAGEA
ncbi:MAG TPA: glycosyltransferase [Bryobacteraceae bacterium]|nr:glycosyltransferase [Bryobacteraceae bacterium]